MNNGGNNMFSFISKIELLKRIQKLELWLEYLETKEEGEMLAYQVARLKFGMDADMAEKRSRYVAASNMDSNGVSGCYVMVNDNNDCWIWKGTLQQARDLVNKLEAQKHRDNCLHLNEEEEELVLDRRRKDWDSNWVQVKPRSKQKKGK